MEMVFCDLHRFTRPGWEIVQGVGPVIATAVHAGHSVSNDLEPRYAVDAQTRRLEEDPMTGIWASVGDHTFRCYVSRFEIDLNRARDRAVYREPEDAWGIDVWTDQPTDQQIERSLEAWDSYYTLMRTWLEHLIAEQGRVLLLDIHSYNHRRDGAFSNAAPQEDNPDIDLGVTTSDRTKFGSVIDLLTTKLREKKAAGRKLDVRENVRYPDGGHWPEWVFAEFGDHVATVTLEYKKFYMDEWSGTAFLPVVEDLRQGLAEAVSAVKPELEG